MVDMHILQPIDNNEKLPFNIDICIALWYYIYIIHFLQVIILVFRCRSTFCFGNYFICNVKEAVSSHILSWIISFSSHAEIISPDTVIKQ